MFEQAVLNLIIPPIIIVLAIAGLIIFLARVIPRSDEKARAKQFRKDESNEVVLNDVKHVSNSSSAVELKSNKESKLKGFFSNFKFSKSKKRSRNTQSTFPSTGQLDGVGVKNNSAPTNLSQDSDSKFSLMGEILVNNQNNIQDDNDGEEAELVRQISVNSRSPESYRRLGDFYVENDRLRDARECYKYVLRLAPRHKRAQLAMKRLDRILD